jgi:hypothetical protein
VKSYLAGNPAIRLALNEDLAIGRQEGAGPRWGTGGGDVVMLDDCNFHESVSLDRFETERMLELVPPDGEFALMQYRRGSDKASPQSNMHSVTLDTTQCSPEMYICPATACIAETTLAELANYIHVPTCAMANLGLVL